MWQLKLSKHMWAGLAIFPFLPLQLPRSVVMFITFRSEARELEGTEQPSVAVLWREKRFLGVSRGYWEGFPEATGNESHQG